MAVWSEVCIRQLTNDVRLDAEFYRPEYLVQDKLAAKLSTKLMRELCHVTDGNHLTIAEQFTDVGIRYLRGQDLIDFFISDAAPVYIPTSEYTQLTRSHMKPFDILLSIVGTIGSVSLVTEKYPSLTGSCKIAILRPRTINPFYLAIYLTCRIGQEQLGRRIRGAVQQGLILPDLKDFPVPIVGSESIAHVQQLVERAYNCIEESKAIYDEAENLLLDEIGLHRLDLTRELSFERPFKAVAGTGRFDAEHFRPMYDRVAQAMVTCGAKEILPLETLLDAITNGQTPTHHDLSSGEIPFLTAEHILDFRIEFNSEKRVLLSHHENELQRTQLREHDILVTIKGRIGNAAVVAALPGPTNINQDVALLRLKSGYHPYFVAGWLNSTAGKALVEKASTGQINPFIGLGNLRSIAVPIFDHAQMTALGDHIELKVNQARGALLRGNQLLDEARAYVEHIIKNNDR